MKAAETSWVTNLRPGRRKDHTGPAWMVVEEGQCKETSEIHPVLQAGAMEPSLWLELCLLVLIQDLVRSPEPHLPYVPN